MPGTILLADLERANDDELRNHLSGLFSPPTSSDSLTNPLGTGNAPAAPLVPPELEEHVATLLAPPPEPTPPPVPLPSAPPGGLETSGPPPVPLPSSPPGGLDTTGVAPVSLPTGPPASVLDELANHVQQTSGGALQLLGQGMSALGSGAEVVGQGAQNVISLARPPAPTPAAPATTAATPDPDLAARLGGAAPGSSTAASGTYQDYAREAARRAGIDPELFVAQIQQESGFNPGAGSPAGALGIAQIVPKYHPGVDPSNPYASLDYAANLMKSHLRQYGGDYAKALVAYNGGAGAVAQLERGTPYQESQQYLARILGQSRPNVNEMRLEGTSAQPRVPGAAPATRDISQFGSQELTAAEAAAACGPAAAVRFAQRFGRNPTLGEATKIAATVGWTEGQGMAGLGSEKRLLDKMGVANRMVSGRAWDEFARVAQTGNPVIISTPGHYFYADTYDPTTKKFHVGASGTDLKRGAAWMSQAEMESVMGTAQGGLVSDNPTVPAGLDGAVSPARETAPDRGGQQIAQVEAPQPLKIIGEAAEGAKQRAGDVVAGGLRIIDSAVEAARDTASQAGQQLATGGPPPAASMPTPSDTLTNPTVRQAPPPGLETPTQLPSLAGPAVLPALDQAQQALRSGDTDSALAALDQARQAVATSSAGPVLGALLPGGATADAIGEAVQPTDVREANRAARDQLIAQASSPELREQAITEMVSGNPLDVLGRSTPGGLPLAGDAVSQARKEQFETTDVSKIPVVGGALGALVEDPSTLLPIGGGARLAAETPEVAALAARAVTAAERKGGGRVADNLLEFLRNESGELDPDAIAAAARQAADRLGLSTKQADAVAQAAARPGPRTSNAIDYDALAKVRRDARAAQPGLPDMPNPTESRLNREIAASVNNMFAVPSMTTNALGGAIETVKRPVVTAFTGDLGAAGADLRAMGLGLGDALADARTTFRTGVRPSRAPSAEVVGQAAYEGQDILDPRSGAWRIGFLRTMEATDEFMRSLNSAGAQASELARLMKAHPDLSQAELRERFGGNLLDVGERAAAESVYAVGGTGIGRRMSQWRSLLTAPDSSPGERVLGAVSNVLVPFSNIPDVILTQGIKRLPIANELTMVAQLRSSNPQVRQRAIASAVLSEAVNLAIFAQVQEGNITGNGPADPAKKAALQNARDAAGDPIWQPNSVRIGGRWLPYASLGPVGLRMGAIANVTEQISDELAKPSPSQDNLQRIQNTALAVLDGTSETIADAWYLQTVGRLFNAMKNGGVGSALGQTALSTVQRGIPYGGELRSVEGATDPTVAEPRNPLEAIAAGIPGVSQLATPKIDPTTGRPLQRPADAGTLLTRSPGTGEPTPVDTALATHNIGVPDAPQTITQREYTVNITPDEQRQYTIEAGQRIEKNVQALLNNPRWSSQTQEQQKDALRQAIGAARADAAALVWRSIPATEQDRRVKETRARQAQEAEPVFRAPVTTP